MSEALRSPLLAATGVRHAFGTRDAVAPPQVVRPLQVHGTAVLEVGAGALEAGTAEPAVEADAVVCRLPDVAVGVVTADCVPVLLASRDGRVVGALHAGWRGLAAGVLAQGLARVAEHASDEILAAVGPAAGGCCYEVDAPVLDALAASHADALTAHTHATRPGHARLDLAGVARDALLALGLAPQNVERISACTICDARRFHSYRRDGDAAGRLLHWIAAAPASG